MSTDRDSLAAIIMDAALDGELEIADAIIAAGWAPEAFAATLAAIIQKWSAHPRTEGTALLLDELRTLAEPPYVHWYECKVRGWCSMHNTDHTRPNPAWARTDNDDECYYDCEERGRDCDHVTPAGEPPP